jgi:hypothetical protein
MSVEQMKFKLKIWGIMYKLGLVDELDTWWFNDEEHDAWVALAGEKERTCTGVGPGYAAGNNWW